MNLAFVLFSAFLLLTGKALAHPVKYDQRQEGDLNVRTDVEDVVFVVVPPQDLVAAGMGIVAATAADLLRKNYGAMGPERWPQRTPPKHGFVALEKSPYKIDLEKSGVQVKKITPTGDPNRYNFHEHKNPSKVVSELKLSTTKEVPVKSTTEKMMENIQEEMQSTTENKTVKKDLKPEEPKKEMMDEKKPEQISVKPEKKTEEKLKSKPEKKTEETKVKTEEMKEVKDTKQVRENKRDEGWRVVGEFTEHGLDPDSIFRIEGCGPDAYRDEKGMCVYTAETFN